MTTNQTQIKSAQLQSRKASLRKQATIETLSAFDTLPDSASIRLQVAAAHQDVSIATAWRRIKTGVWPQLENGRMNVGKFRRAITSHSVAA